MANVSIGRRNLAKLILLSPLALNATMASSQMASDGLLPLTDIEPNLGSFRDFTDIFERAFEAAARRQLGGVLVPPGEFLLRRVNLPSKQRLVGAGRAATILRTIRSNSEAFVTIGDGPIIHASIENLTLLGGGPTRANSRDQWAIDCQARPKAGATVRHGGLWWSIFSNIQVVHFGKGIRFGGDETQNFLLPHQFLSIRDLVVFLAEDAPGPALKMTGQVNQVLLQQCQFDHVGERGDQTLVEIGVPGDVSGPFVAPTVVRFDVCTFQNASQAVSIYGAQNISFNSCWFEELDAGIKVDRGAVGISIKESRFANAASYGAAIEFLGGTQGVVIGNIFAGPRTRTPYHFATDAKISSIDGVSIWGAGKL